MTYADFAESILRTSIITDPWLSGEERFDQEPVILTAETYKRLCAAAEAIGKVYEELAQLIWQNPLWLDTFFHLTPFQKLMWLSSGGSWHVIARLDLFLCMDGSIKTAEMNSDTPSGEAETVVLNELIHSRYPHLKNPNRGFESKFCQAVIDTYQLATSEPTSKPTIGIIYPTDLPEDLSMIALYKTWFELREWKTVLGSPINLSKSHEGKLRLMDVDIDIAIRHYKTDWWGERESAWLDGDPITDSLPLTRELKLIIEAEQRGHLILINPFGSVLTQNKLTMAFCHLYKNLFSESAQETIETVIPETHRLLDASKQLLYEPKAQWVLKSDYGCEGDEVILGKSVTEEIWKLSLENANPNRWIAQKYFETAPLERGTAPNYGVYLIAGKAAGIFTRLSKGPTDYHSKVAPTFVK
jgi:glutathionylspermidine synthase